MEGTLTLPSERPYSSGRERLADSIRGSAGRRRATTQGPGGEER